MPLTDAQKDTIKWIARVQNSARGSDAVIVSRFSQCTPPVSTLIGMYGSTSDGVCQALSNKWVADHASGGSLWNSIYVGGIFQQGVIANLMLQFMDSLGQGAGREQQKAFKNQDIHAEKYLFHYGVVRRQDIVSGKRHFYAGTSTNPEPGLGIRLASALTGEKGNRNSAGAYQLIYIYGASGAHAMAAWVAEDVSFFDPNFGEFWFAKPAKFREWFAGFWTASGYSGSFNRYELRSFGKKMGHVTSRPGMKRGDRL